MNEREHWINKLILEEPLTLAETLQLEQALESQSGMRNVVENLDDDSPSLAWRSKLNERLLAETPQSKAKFNWRSIVGFGSAATACALAAYVIFARPSAVLPGSDPAPLSTESVLVAAHESNSFVLDSASSSGSQPVSEKVVSETITWSEEDLGAL